MAEVGSPPAGWYVDPSGAYRARYWDGQAWTEHVCDDVPSPACTPREAAGERVVPHPAAATVAGVAQALAAVAGDEPTGHDSPLATNAHAPVSAGQASLALLPEPEPDEPPPAARRRPPAKVGIGGVVVLAGALGLVVGSFMAWMHIRGPAVGYSTSRTGVDLGDGRVTIVLGAVLAALAAIIVTGRFARLGGAKTAAMGALVAGAAAVTITAVDIADVVDRSERFQVALGAVTDVGAGLWLGFVGSLLVIGGGLLAFANRS